MGSRVGLSTLSCAVALICALGLSAARAQDCAVPSPPVVVNGGTVTLESQMGWQAAGGEIELTIKSPKLTDDQKIVVCFRWKLQRGDPGAWLKAETIRVLDRQGDTLKIAATVPIELLKKAPKLPRHVKPDDPLGVYEVNDSVPVADVHVAFFDTAGTVAIGGDATIGVTANGIQCNVPGPQTTADLGKAKPNDRKNWQPRGGEVEFTITSTKANIAPDSPIRICFRWKLASKADPKDFLPSGPIRIIDRQPDSIRVAVTIPNIPPAPPFWGNTEGSDPVGTYTGFWLVPQADVRLLVFSPKGSVLVDVWSVIGITNLGYAIGFALLAVAIAFYVLWRICCRRLPHLATSNPVLCIVSNRWGYASLSQFQVILWTFLVGGSAVYVMALAGDLIEISTGTLVLLGISGTTTVAAKLKGENDTVTAVATGLPGSATAIAAAAAARAIADRDADALKTTVFRSKGRLIRFTAEAEAAAAEADARKAAADAIVEYQQARDAAARATAEIAKATTPTDIAAAEGAVAAADALVKTKEEAALKAVAAADALSRRKPLWSDLVVDEAEDREISVARVQMLFFTLITAGFVLMQVLQSYNIPGIPEGFLILMGISNGV